MSQKPKPARRYPDWENTCNYCLYLQPGPRDARSGNCTYHRQWIQRSAFSTCSEMSAQPLDDGIYTLTTTAYGSWTYDRRHEHIRTRLFLVQGGAHDTPSQTPRKQNPNKKRG